MLPPGARLRRHSLVALALAASCVVAPLALIFDARLGAVATAVGVALLGLGAACLLGALLSCAAGSGGCATELQRRCTFAAPWLLNPVAFVVLGCRTGYLDLARWSCVPLGAALVLLRGWPRVLAAGGPHSLAHRLYLVTQVLLCRAALFGAAACLLSLQVALYLPQAILPSGSSGNAIMWCAECVLFSAKCYAACSCLARQRPTQVAVLLICLSADCICSLRLMLYLSDPVNRALLLGHLLAAGVLQLQSALRRLQLRTRWARALAQHGPGTSARQPAAERSGRAGDAADPELGTRMLLPGRGESSDSDDESGPGSLPSGFYETLLAVLGVPSLERRPGREWLCAPRSAVGAAAAGGARAAGRAGCEAEGPGVRAAIEIAQHEKTCIVCLDDIVDGQSVRPLARCGHKFHAACLERWTATMREATRCPVCRRPALSREQAEGATHLSSLTLGGVEEHRVRVQCNPRDRLGLDIRMQDYSLRILNIDDGPFLHWNRSADCLCPVRTGDDIVQVNRVRGSGFQLLQALINRGSCVELVLARASDAPGEEADASFWSEDERERREQGYHDEQQREDAAGGATGGPSEGSLLSAGLTAVALSAARRLYRRPPPADAGGPPAAPEAGAAADVVSAPAAPADAAAAVGAEAPATDDVPSVGVLPLRGRQGDSPPAPPAPLELRGGAPRAAEAL